MTACHQFPFSRPGLLARVGGVSGVTADPWEVGADILEAVGCQRKISHLPETGGIRRLSGRKRQSDGRSGTERLLVVADRVPLCPAMRSLWICRIGSTLAVSGGRLSMFEHIIGWVGLGTLGGIWYARRKTAASFARARAVLDDPVFDRRSPQPRDQVSARLSAGYIFARRHYRRSRRAGHRPADLCPSYVHGLVGRKRIGLDHSGIPGAPKATSDGGPVDLA